MLTLPIKRQWYDMIVSGQKLEEYREPDYWLPRLKKEAIKQFGIGKTGFDGVKVRIRAGYRVDSPTAILTLEYAVLAPGFAEWGAVPGVEYLVLRIRKVEQLRPVKEQLLHAAGLISQ